jgi:hypothetical protein
MENTYLKNYLAKSINKDIINHMPKKDLIKLNTMLDNAQKRIVENSGTGYKTQKEKEIEIETKFQTHKDSFPDNADKLRSILTGLSF